LVSQLRFAWDPAKDALNQRKHGVPFDEATTAFSDEAALLSDDPDHSVAEERFVLLGPSPRWRALLVVHCYRADDAVIRLIGARKADRQERARYAQRWQL
jgi:uncharacterized DUF497 family protein